MMRLSFAVLFAAAVVLGGCWKSDTKAVLKADGSGTMTYESSYKLESIEAVKERMEEMRARAEENGRDPGPQMEQAETRIKDFTNGFEPAKVTADLKAKGIEVKSATPFEKDGWKGVKVEATFADINQVLDLARAQREAARAAEEEARGGGEEEGQPRRRGGMMGRMGRMGSQTDASASIPVSFKKTDAANVGQAVLIPPRQAPGGGEGGGQGGRRGGQGGGRMGADIPGMDEIRRTLRLTLPGKIVETTNCKQEGENTVILDIKGSDMQPDEDGNLPPVITNGASVRFEIPEGCKIRFEDAATPKPDIKKEGEPKEGEKPKRGGVKIGDGD